MRKITFLLLITLLLASFLRLWKLSEVPVSLFGDELDVGYQAYSILKTGRDYSGNVMPLHFQSLAEWRTPLYLYSAIPTVALFGITPLGVRLPAALFGVISILGLYLLVKELMNFKVKDTIQAEYIALISALIMSLNPWHIQYSRAGFEVTELLAFLIFGLYFFFRSLRENGKWLWISSIFLVLTPWIYSTAKLFTPLLFFFLLLVWRKQIFSLPRKSLLISFLVIVVLGAPIALSTIFGGGSQRFGYVSVFTDPTLEQNVGEGRSNDAKVEGVLVSSDTPAVTDKVFHNKFEFWANRITSNYLQSLSTEFLFYQGDPNLRHTVPGFGEFFKIEYVFLLIGVIFFFTAKIDLRVKLLIAFWILGGIIPASITRDGGNHATRLILILPPIIFLTAYGLSQTYSLISGKFKFIFVIGYSALFLLSFIFYQHYYWNHYPWDSEKWWHSGWQDAIQSIKEVDRRFDRVVITMSDEPAWIFFAAWYPYDPGKWQQGYPMQKTTLNGFGEVSYIDKYFFGSFHSSNGGIYDLPKYIDGKTLYLASAKEIGANLIQEPQRVPNGLTLLKAIAYPSGEPAFYLFTAVY